MTIDGAPGAEHRYVIDGLDTTNLRTGVAARDLPRRTSSSRSR